MKVLLIVAPTVLVAHKGFAAEEVHKETLLHQRSAQSDRFLTPLDPAQTMKLLRALRVRHYFDEVALLPQATGISPAPKIPALHQSRPVVPLLQQQATVRWFRAVAGYALASVRDLRGVFLWGRAKRERLCCRLVLVPFDHREIRERVKMMVNKGPYNAVYSDERGGKRKRLGGIMGCVWETLMKCMQFNSTIFVTNLTDRQLTSLGIGKWQAAITDIIIIPFPFPFSGDMRPHGRASHLLVVTFDLAAMLLVGAYSAAIISTLASKPMPLPYKSVSHLLRNPGHRVTFAEDSAEKCVIMNSKDPTLTRISNMWGYPRPPDTVRSTGHGVRRLCEDNWAFFGRYRLIYNMTLLQSSQCLPVELPGAHVNLNVAFLWAPNRRYLRLFNYRINCLRRAGILQKYFSKPWESRDPDEQFVAVRLLNVVPLFAMLAVGAGGALLLLAVEIVCAYCTRGRHLPPWDRYNNKNLK
ncbi:Ionotropic receptor 118 [Gryllus bimaculatus]|nr:Ionotropic receptor 118 [Gryllus bimaculatus]